jgi:selenocysteine-specific elongation factor
VAELSLRRALDSGLLVAIGQTRLATAEHSARSGAQTAAVEQELFGLIEGAGFACISEAEVAQQAKRDVALVRSALGRLSTAGCARRLTGLWFAEAAIERLRDVVRRHFESHAELGVADLKQLCGVSRKQAIPLLEQLDREGTTRRAGNARMAGPRLKDKAPPGAAPT